MKVSHTKIILSWIVLYFAATHLYGQNRINASISKNLNSEERSLSQKFKKYNIIEMDPAQLSSFLTNNNQAGVFTLEVGDKHTWNIALEQNDIRSKNYSSTNTTETGKIIEERGPCRTYKGTKDFNKKNSVRLSIYNDHISGFIKDGDKTFYIDPLSNYYKNSDKKKYVLYEEKDVLLGSSFTCSYEHVDKEIQRLERSVYSLRLASLTTPDYYLEIATEADYEYYSIYGAGTNDHILSILNQTEDVFLSTFNMSFTVVYQNFYSTSSDPYSYAGTDIFSLRNEFITYWNNNFSHVHRDMVQLYTGRSGDFVGVADGLGTVCDPLSGNTSSYLVCRNYGVSAGQKVLTAHEMGHCFNAYHESASDCPDGSHPDTILASDPTYRTGPIMCGNMQYNAWYFSPTSIAVIQSHIDNHSDCLLNNSCQETLVIGPIALSDNTNIQDYNIIETDGTVTTPNSYEVNFIAVSEIIFKPGFVSPSGSIFTATIDDCSSTVLRKATTEDDGFNQDLINANQEGGNLSLKVYPNPANHIATVKAPMNIQHLSLYNSSGIRIDESLFTKISNTEFNIDAHELPSGLYFINVITIEDKSFGSTLFVGTGK